MECELLTGRTHQIRAQFAAAGHPLLGDGKYGRERDNKRYGRAFQALYSYKLEFTFPTDAGMLEYLRGRVFTVDHVDFVEAYFPASKRERAGFVLVRAAPAPGRFPSSIQPDDNQHNPHHKAIRYRPEALLCLLQLVNGDHQFRKQKGKHK